MAELQVVNEWLIANGMTEQAANLFDQSNDIVNDTPLAASPEEAEQLAQSGVGPTGPQSETAIEAGAAVETEVDNVEAYDESLDQAAEAGGQVLLDAIEMNQIVEQGALEAALGDLAPEGLTPAAREGWLREAAEAADKWAQNRRSDQRQAEGESEEDADAGAADDVAAVTTSTTIPEWMRESAMERGYAFTSANDYDFSPELKQRFLDYYNANYGTSFDDFDALVQTMGEPLQEVTDVWTSALLGDEPTLARTVEISGMESVTLSQDDIDILVGNYGLSSDGVNRLVRLAYMNRGVDAEGNMRPVDLYALAAAARGMGLTVGLTDQERRDREITQLEDQIAELRSGPQSQLQQASIEQLQRRLFSLQRMNTPTSGGGPNAPGIHGIRNSLYTGLERYNDNQVLAVLHVLDPGLASRIAATGGDPEKLDPRDNARAYDLLIDAGVVERDANGFRPDNAVLANMASYFGIGQGAGGGGGGGGGRIRRTIDPEQVRQAANSMWESVLRGGDAPDELVSALQKSLQSALDKAPEGQDFDISARLQTWIESQPRYGQLYGKKPGGTTDQEWMGQFISGQQSILGQEIPTGGDPVALGMESGTYQTAVGAAAGTKAAWNNSTWMERLANAASVVAQNT
jgi:hypothetical protein